MATKQQALPDDNDIVDLADSFIANCHSSASPAASSVAPAPAPVISPHVEDWGSKSGMSREQLIVIVVSFITS